MCRFVGPIRLRTGTTGVGKDANPTHRPQVHEAQLRLPSKGSGCLIHSDCHHSVKVLSILNLRLVLVLAFDWDNVCHVDAVEAALDGSRCSHYTGMVSLVVRDTANGDGMS